MKSSRITVIIAAIFAFSCAVRKTELSDSSVTASHEVWSTFDLYVVQNHALALDLAKKHGMEMPPQVENFFAAAQKHDWIASSNLFLAIETDSRKGSTGGLLKPFPLWGAIHDTYGVYEIFHWMNPKFAKMFGAEIVRSIPAGSIYFGGSDGGRFLVSAFSKSHSKGQLFYTITQNGLADPSYLGYVTDMYGDKIHVADTNDSRKCLEDYRQDARERLLHDQTLPNEPRQIKPGEDVHLDADGKAQVNGQIAVMAINALIAKTFFDKNPTNEFYVEESFPLDWMFPHLTPSGLIMKVNRAEIPELTEDELKKDHEFWAKTSKPLVGDWIAYDTSVKEVTAFAEKIYLHHDYNGFKGDEDFIRDHAAHGSFSKLRCSIAGIYTWRLGQPPSGGTMPKAYIATGKNRSLVEREADFAFKQAFALCPSNPGAVFRYVQFLVNLRRVEDALLIVETARKIDPDNGNFPYLMDNLTRIKQQISSTGDIQNEIARLEKAVDANSTNVMQQFGLAQKYVQAGQNEKAYQVLDRVLASSQVTLQQVMTVAKAYNDLGQPKKLQGALEKLTQLAPESPEAWYDLAASQATLGQTVPALESLKKSLTLNSKRMETNATATDLNMTLTNDVRFSKLRDTAEFKALTAK
jgi:thioredoxin-like negative regulator of GroEL